MPIKPSKETLNAYDAYRQNPNFGHDAIEAMLNDPQNKDAEVLRNALLSAGLVEEVDVNESGSRP